jgi:hypothetical protein
MTARVPARAAGLCLLLLGLVLVSGFAATGQSAPPARSAPPAQTASPAPEVRFDPATASGDFGEVVTFETTFRAAQPPERVELLTRLPDEEASSVSRATLDQVGEGTWRAVVRQPGHIVPNTTWEYRFRVVTSDGSFLGPTERHTVRDTRIDWQRLDGDGVTVWWDRGDRGFAERALGVAEEAVANASDLLGVKALAPVDFFIYSDDREFRQALGPGTRENVGGEAHPTIHTLFGLIEPGQEGSDWVEELVRHELTHLVFDEAVVNPYSYPPRWLNEGLAVYLAKGYTDGDRARVEAAARAGDVIPLEGLAGQFPTRPGGFSLAYAESVSAVAHLVDRFDEPTLARLITSFADGLSVDEAFVVATGAGFTAFEDGWFASLGAERPRPYGPQPGEAGPFPSAWASAAPALLP